MIRTQLRSPIRVFANGRTLSRITFPTGSSGCRTGPSRPNSSLAATGPARSSVRSVGGGKLKFTRDAAGLRVSLPEKFNGNIAFALKIGS
jgi:hypothetical protein